jgi:hypothetical protein
MNPLSSLAYETSVPDAASGGSVLDRLRILSYSGLRRMYAPGDRLFRFRLRLTSRGLVAEGLSHRYTAITLVGLANDAAAVSVLANHTPAEVCSTLLDRLDAVTNLGDAALTLWAAQAVRHRGAARAVSRLRELDPMGAHPTVEVAWSLAALCVDSACPDPRLRDQLAERLMNACPDSNIFPHTLGAATQSARSHVACFADLVYPVHALARYLRFTDSERAASVVERVARTMCALQGPEGQWWWHYDVRTGRVVEDYPVYAVHQDSMAPMALLEAEEVTGVRTMKAIVRGLHWLESARELAGGSLIDPRHDIVWRKVARREPNKLSRRLQAAVTGVHDSLRVPGLDLPFPPNRIDFEDRPYHLGWVLYAWNGARVRRAIPQMNGPAQ